MNTPDNKNNNPNKKADKVIRINDKKEVLDTNNLLGKTKSKFLTLIKPQIDAFFDSLDDTLFDLAEKAETNRQQTLFFDGMREVRKKKGLMTRLFSERLEKVFTEFKRGHLNFFDAEKNTDISGDLALVDDEDLEENLAIDNLIAKAETAYHQPLFALKKRFSLLGGGAELDNKSLPLGPFVIVHSFAESIQELDTDIQIKLILYKLFERHLIAGLHRPYGEINQYLAEHGVCPTIKFDMARPVGGGYRGPAPAPMPPGAVPENTLASGEQVPAAGAPVGYSIMPTGVNYQVDPNFQAISSAFASRAVATMADGPTPAGTPIDMGLLINALSLLQTTSATDTEQSPEEIKKKLLEQLRTLDDSADEKHVDRADEDIIDLVGMLFQFLVEDRNLPAKIQAILARLQIPYLKVALQDRHLFANKEHPARQLLDTLSTASVGWAEESDPKGQFIEKITRITDTILHEYDDDLELFNRLHADLKRFLERRKKRATVAEKRVTEATLGREKVKQAKRTAANVLVDVMQDHTLPDMVRDILLKPWANVLILMHLRHGENSEAFQQYVTFAQKLAEYADPAHIVNITGEDLKQLMEEFSNGLELVVVPEPEIRHKTEELYQYLASINGIEAGEIDDNMEFIAPEEILQLADNEPDTSEVQEFIQEIVLSEDEDETEIETDDYNDIVENLEVGTWFEFTNSEGKTLRAKLSWISPISGKLLFVNARGLKVMDKSPAGLAADLRGEKARILEQIPLFDRALSAIASKLKDSSEEDSGN